MNFSSFLYQTRFTDRFSGRELMILDEGHNIETQLMSFVSISISDASFNNLIMPELETPEEYAEWMYKFEILAILQSRLDMAIFEENAKEIDEVKSLITKLKMFLSEMDKKDHEPWIVEYEKGRAFRKITLKPVFIRNYSHEYLFSMADHVLIMSATILDVNVMCNALGISKDQKVAKRTNSLFPIENCQIYYKPAAKITGGANNMPNWAPKLVKSVNEIINEYPKDKGIIHTHNFAIADLLVSGCTPEIRKRLLYQKFFESKAEMLATHEKSQDTIIVAPAMHEGLDLKDDLSRFQILCKVPFPNFYADKQLAMRKELDPTWIDWLTALKLTQSCGRSIRSETDWAKTYIIDESFRWWYERNKKMLPIWFIESIIGI
jgi:Rad3-related DNA helicase